MPFTELDYHLLSTLAHVVFTLPQALAPLALQNKAVYGLLMRASADTLLQVARDPRHLGAEIGRGAQPMALCTGNEGRSAGTGRRHGREINWKLM